MTFHGNLIGCTIIKEIKDSIVLTGHGDPQILSLHGEKKPTSDQPEPTQRQVEEVKCEEVKDAIIPDKCVKAIEKVLVPTVSRNGVVMNTQVQMRKAVQQIDRTSNVEVAFLLMVGRELGFVKASAQTTDFVRALIGLRLLDYTSDEAIRNMADGINKKIKNLPSKHNTWAEDERTIANAIERALLG